MRKTLFICDGCKDARVEVTATRLVALDSMVRHETFVPAGWEAIVTVDTKASSYDAV